LPVCTSTVIADELPAAADAAADELPAAAEDAELDGELLVPPELQAVARTAAAASGTPSRSANEAFLDENRLFICCDSPLPRNSIPHRNLGTSTAGYADRVRRVQPRAMPYITRIRRWKGEFTPDATGRRIT